MKRRNVIFYIHGLTYVNSAKITKGLHNLSKTWKRLLITKYNEIQIKRMFAT